MSATIDDVKESGEPHERSPGWPLTVAAWLVTASIAVIPLLCAPDLLDRFRIVKESAARAEALLLLPLLVLLLGRPGTGNGRMAGAIIAGSVGWTAVAAAISTHRSWSAAALITVATSGIVAAATLAAAPRVRLVAFDLLAVAAGVNSALIVAQEYGFWNPFRIDPNEPLHLASTALLGNPNIAGSYLSLATIALAAGALALSGARRSVYAVAAAAGVAGVVASQTRTALIALVAGMLALAAIRSWRAAAATVAAAGVLIFVGLATEIPIIVRLVQVPKLLVSGELSSGTSHRTSAFLSAYEMFRDRPLAGLGPGTFGFHYMPYRERADARYAAAASDTARVNFGETHNDHLQILAEAGVPGYLAFLAALAVTASVAFRRRGAEESARAKLARSLSFPFVTTVFVLCLAQFPLQVAATRHLVITLAALIVGWSRR